MPVVTEPASRSGRTSGSFYVAQCDGCGTDCPPRALHNPAMAKIAAEARGWLVQPRRWSAAGTRVVCPDCRRGPKFAA